MSNDMKMVYLFDRDTKLKHLGQGEWVDEPDVARFIHNGIECYIRRIFVKEPYATEEHYFGGYLCGYVAIPLNHPWASQGYNVDCEVHGGCTHNGPLYNAKHLVGFDCAHSGDVTPSMESVLKNSREKNREKWPEVFSASMSHFWNPTYKNMNFVIEECKSLADQAIKAAHGK